jgi:phospholipase C
MPFARHAAARFAAATAVGLSLGVASSAPAVAVGASPASSTSATAGPIKHLVVIFDENVSFDHYFGTYPHAANPSGEPAFHALPGTPKVNGLTKALLTHNPNSANPTRLGRSQAFTCDNDHGYTSEQKAFDGGKMDRFIETTGPARPGCDPRSVMDYYDGNTVTALWNYAQRFAMSDSSYDATFGPTLLGHLNLVAGQTHGATVTGGTTSAVPNGTVISNIAPRTEDCADPNTPRIEMSGRNIGDLLNARHVSWGYFYEGFRATSRNADGSAVCGASHANLAGAVQQDYYPSGKEPFQYWESTANPHHLPPSSTAEIGHAGPANHQYDLADFWSAADAGTLPSVSYLNPAGYDDGHPQSSDPLDEQRFIVNAVNRIERLPSWKSTAVVVAYDDSDGWYDHQMSPIRNSSQDPAHDALDGTGVCGNGQPAGGYLDRCGYGSRQPLLVLSPYAKRNAVDHTPTTQASILRFVQDNWLGGQRIGDASFDATAGSLNGMFDFKHLIGKPLLLDPTTGQPTSAGQLSADTPGSPAGSRH